MKKLNVVIADTNDALLGNLKATLENDDTFNVTCIAKDGETVLKALTDNEIDIVITDLILPIIDGLTIIEHVMNSKTLHKPKFIVMSGVTSDKIINTTFALGAAYFVLKPFDNEALIRRVKQISLLEYQENGNLHTVPNRTFELNKAEIIPQISPSMDMEYRITEIVHELGVPTHIKGYRYLIQAITLCVNDIEMLGAVTKIMYPEIAKKFNTTPSRVERAIRHSIELSWQHCSPAKLYNIFGYTVNTKKSKPTNSEYIALISDKIRLEYKQNEQNVI